MKKTLIFGLVSILLLPVLMIGCNTEEPPTKTTMPPITSGQEAKTIELTLDDFTAQNNIVKDIDIIRPGSLIVSLGSNPTTGYQWGEAEISAPSVIAQQSHNFVEPQASGKIQV